MDKGVDAVAAPIGGTVAYNHFVDGDRSQEVLDALLAPSSKWSPELEYTQRKEREAQDEARETQMNHDNITLKMRIIKYKSRGF